MCQKSSRNIQQRVNIYSSTPECTDMGCGKPTQMKGYTRQSNTIGQKTTTTRRMMPSRQVSVLTTSGGMRKGTSIISMKKGMYIGDGIGTRSSSTCEGGGSICMRWGQLHLMHGDACPHVNTSMHACMDVFIQKILYKYMNILARRDSWRA